MSRKELSVEEALHAHIEKKCVWYRHKLGEAPWDAAYAAPDDWSDFLAGPRENQDDWEKLEQAEALLGKVG